jgi:hypothetical protein
MEGDDAWQLQIVEVQLVVLLLQYSYLLDSSIFIP